MQFRMTVYSTSFWIWPNASCFTHTRGIIHIFKLVIYVHSCILLRRIIFFGFFFCFLCSFVNYLPQQLQWPQLVGDTLTVKFPVIDRLKWQMSMRKRKKTRSKKCKNKKKEMKRKCIRNNKCQNAKLYIRIPLANTHSGIHSFIYGWVELRGPYRVV